MTDNSDSNNNALSMAFDELLKERRRDRRWRYVRFTTIALLIAFSVFTVAGLNEREQPEDFAGESYVAYVDIDGVIMPDSRTASQSVLARPLERAFEDEKAEGVLIRVSSPGGTPVQAELIRSHIARLADKHEKKVVVVGEEMLTSGAYLLSADADVIYAQPSTIVGSIGVRMSGFGATDLIERVGVERRVYSAGESKVTLDPFMKEDPEAVSHMTAMLEDIHHEFIEVVKRGRGERLSNDKDLFDGNVWTGNRALELGLIDKLGFIHEAAENEFGTTNLKEYGPKTGLMARLGMLAGHMGAVMQNASSHKVNATWQP